MTLTNASSPARAVLPPSPAADYHPSRRIRSACPYPDCSAAISNVDSYSVCDTCRRVAIRCAPLERRTCGSWNRPASLYCRGCGRVHPRNWSSDAEVRVRNRSLNAPGFQATASSEIELVRAEDLYCLIAPEPNRPDSETPYEFELERVGGWLWIGHSDGSFKLIEPFAALANHQIAAGRANPWPHDLQSRRWTANGEGPWLVQSSGAGVRVFCTLASVNMGQSTLPELFPGGWVCPPAEKMLGRPIIVGFEDATDRSARKLYWLTRSADNPESLRIWYWAISLSTPMSAPTNWTLSAEGLSAVRGAGIVALPTGEPREPPRLLVAGGKALLAFAAPIADRPLPKILSVSTPFQMDLGTNFADTLRLFVLPQNVRSRDPISVAVGVEDGIAARRFARVVVGDDEIQFSMVMGTGHPVGVANLDSGSVWVYLNESILGWVNTLEQVNATRELQRADRFDEIRVAGRVIALSGQNESGRGILRVCDLTTRKFYHTDESPLAGSRFTLPAIIGAAILTVDQHDHGSRSLSRYWLYDPKCSGNGS